VRTRFLTSNHKTTGKSVFIILLQPGHAKGVWVWLFCSWHAVSLQFWERAISEVYLQLVYVSMMARI